MSASVHARATRITNSFLDRDVKKWGGEGEGRSQEKDRRERIACAVNGNYHARL